MKSFDNMNSKSMFYIIISTIIILVVFGNWMTLAEDTKSEEYKGLTYCVNCHPAEIVKWSYSPHSNTTLNTVFQSEWKKIGQLKSCLSCHTTGYNNNTESYVFPEVTCEACHGPGDTMVRNTSVQLCATCHSKLYPTYEEWLNSGPAHGNANCLTCHDPHTSKLVYKTPTRTCGQCHDSHVNQLLTTAHGEKGLECSDCHMIQEPPDFINGKQAKTGHSFTLSEEELDCSNCHERPLSKHDVLGEKAFACLSCHGDIHELKLKLVNNKVYPLSEPVLLCAQCHNERYTAWKQGTHGDYNDPNAKCTKCHNPHDPIINNLGTLPPIPPRVEAPPPLLIPLLGVVAFVALLIFLIYYLRRLPNA